MKNFLLALSVSFALVGCGGGGGSTPEQPYSTFIMGSKETPFFATTLKSADGSENLVLSTIDEGNPYAYTPPTPVYILHSEANGSVTNITSSLFANIPKFYWSRNINTFIHPATGTQAIWFCNQGREVGDYLAAAMPRINGIFGEQDALYVMENGKLVDKSDTLPQIVDFSHGCSVAKNSDGSVSLVKRTFGGTTFNQSDKVILNYINGKWVEVYGSGPSNQGLFFGIAQSQIFFTAAGNFQRASFGDNPVFGNKLLTKVNGEYVISASLDAPDLYEQGYTMVQGSTVGDLNNDGWDDLVLILSADGVKLKPFLSGAKLAIFMNDGNGNLVYDPSAIVEYYGDTLFGLDIRIFDINFDGYPDIVVQGERYMFGTNLYYTKTENVLVNNKKGKFNLKTIDGTKLNSKCSDPHCQIGTWFLKGKDSNSYTLMTYSKSGGDKTFYSQTVTPANPLLLK